MKAVEIVSTVTSLLTAQVEFHGHSGQLFIDSTVFDFYLLKFTCAF
jgi:hypothetical protein